MEYSYLFHRFSIIYAFVQIFICIVQILPMLALAFLLAVISFSHFFVWWKLAPDGLKTLINVSFTDWCVEGYVCCVGSGVCKATEKSHNFFRQANFFECLRIMFAGRYCFLN